MMLSTSGNPLATTGKHALTTLQRNNERQTDTACNQFDIIASSLRPFKFPPKNLQTHLVVKQEAEATSKPTQVIIHLQTKQCARNRRSAEPSADKRWPT